VSPSLASSAPPGRWLSLGPASRLLGVDPDTLRRWADDGRIETWTTPGGHRRFDRNGIERLATSRRAGRSGPLASLGATPERLTRVYRRRYQATAAAPGPTSAPRDDAEREAYRHDGRRLVATLVAYLDADEPPPTGGPQPPRRAAIEATAMTVVDDQATRLAAAGTSLTEAVSLFVTARQLFLTELAGLGRRRSLDPAHLAGLYDDATGLLDRLLLRFIGAYQRAA
jgi:excisionase family DNA binding protein